MRKLLKNATKRSNHMTYMNIHDWNPSVNSSYSRPKSFKIERTIYVKNGLDKRPYKSSRQLRQPHSSKSLSKNKPLSRRESEMKRLASSIRGGLYSRQLRRSLRRRKTSAIAAARPAASRPQAYSPQSQTWHHGFSNPTTTPCPSSPLRSPTFVMQKIWMLQAKDRCMRTWRMHACSHHPGENRR